MKAQWKFFELWAPLKTVLFRDGGVSRVLKFLMYSPIHSGFPRAASLPSQKMPGFL